ELMAEAPVNDRVNLLYESKVGDKVESIELPFRLMVLADLSCDERSEYFNEQTPVRLDNANIGILFQQIKPHLDLKVKDYLSESDDDLLIQMDLRSVDDFSPQQIIKQLPALQALLDFSDSLARASSNQTDLATGDDIDLIQTVLKTESVTLEEIRNNGESFGWLISSIEERICHQIDAIVHHPDFKKLEATWRAIQFLIDRTDFTENCELCFLNISKQGLVEDFEDVPEVFQSSLYKHIYSDEFGQFGGRPYGAMVGNYDFGPAAPDIKLLQRIASIAAVSHAPFVAAASPEFFDIDSFSKFSKLRDLASIFGQPRYAKWASFRESEDARYIGLTIPGFLLRPTWDVPIGSLQYQEKIGKGGHDQLWGNSGFAFATRLLDSFAKYRWCLNSTGNPSGLVEGLKIEATGENIRHGKIPTQFILTDRRETEVIEQGFIPLSVHKGDDTAAFYSAYSTQAIGKVGEDDNDLSIRLAAQIPYLLIVGRISQYLKIMQRENIGAWTNRREIDQNLNDWLRQYVSDMDNPAAGVRARRPLRKADIKVREVEGKSDWYVTRIQITPHLKYMGSSFSLSESARLDKN
ncbi:MAG: type VI secretion system protein ImpC, partial [Gammaproteobacteria bacterium]